MVDLAAHLIKSGALEPEGLSRALAAAKDGDVASAALRFGLAQEGALAKALADYHDCPAVDFSRSAVPTANLAVVAAAFCRQRRVVPVSIGNSEMVLAMADPEDHILADELSFVTGRKVLRYAAVPASIERVIEGLVREKGRGGQAWRGLNAPALPDPGAAWVGVVHASNKRDAFVDLPEVLPEDVLQVVEVSDEVARTPFDAPTPARRAAEEKAKSAPEPSTAGQAGEALEPVGQAAVNTVRLSGVGTGKLALVADPVPEPREEMAEILQTLGCTVLRAANGRTALDLIQEARPDLVSLEAIMPMMPGFEVCRAIKGDPVLRPTQVALTSAIHRGTVAADAKAAFGADAFFEKPYRRHEVFRSLKLLLIGRSVDASDPLARASAEQAWREGATLIRSQKFDEAVAVLRQAVARDDLSAEAHYYLGLALAKMGLLFEAAAELEQRSTELRPDVDAGHQLLAQAYESLGFKKSAREAWARAIESCKDETRRRAMQNRLMKLLGM